MLNDNKMQMDFSSLHLRYIHTVIILLVIVISQFKMMNSSFSIEESSEEEESINHVRSCGASNILRKRGMETKVGQSCMQMQQQTLPFYHDVQQSNVIYAFSCARLTRILKETVKALNQADIFQETQHLKPVANYSLGYLYLRCLNDGRRLIPTTYAQKRRNIRMKVQKRIQRQHKRKDYVRQMLNANPWIRQTIKTELKYKQADIQNIINQLVSFSFSDDTLKLMNRYLRDILSQVFRLIFQSKSIPAALQRPACVSLLLTHYLSVYIQKPYYHILLQNYEKLSKSYFGGLGEQGGIQAWNRVMRDAPIEIIKEETKRFINIMQQGSKKQ